MATIMELAAEIIAAHASTTPMSKDELIAELSEVHAALSSLEKGISQGQKMKKLRLAITRKALEKGYSKYFPKWESLHYNRTKVLRFLRRSALVQR